MPNLAAIRKRYEAQRQVAAFRVLRELILHRLYTADELRERFDAILEGSE